ncbi:hypothetical protein G3M48_000168 [Beauveria asiatica]|uniref:Uncharacterized protein n=1 Tax=Beauveria asiatica TaxID=1069075 RepID=A0AAW0RH17_9HYPO
MEQNLADLDTSNSKRLREKFATEQWEEYCQIQAESEANAAGNDSGSDKVGGEAGDDFGNDFGWFEAGLDGQDDDSGLKCPPPLWPPTR